MKKSPRYISGLDIQNDYISVTQYSFEQDAVLLIAIQPVSTVENIDQLQNTENKLKELRGKFKFHSPDVVCSIASDCAVIKHISCDRDEPDLKGMVKWELSQQLISQVDQYVFDFQELLSSNGNSRDVLAVAFHSESVKNLTSMLKKLKLNPLVMDLDIFALINVHEANYKENIPFNTIIVHGESEKTKMVLTKNGVFLDNDSFEYNYEAIDPVSYFQRLQGEISRFAGLSGINAGDGSLRILFTGSLFCQEEFRDAAGGFMGNGEILNPFRKVNCLAGVDEENLAKYSPQLAVAVGLALRGGN
ncbi:MAG: pilus assembly protein PilM [Fibrobacter sp.]|jgi:Tfp pilus assembly PilM family ATPase|nr:pilus assembly protein PilM [Fibrobacter sp.]